MNMLLISIFSILFGLLRVSVCLTSNSIFVFPREGQGIEGEIYRVQVDSLNGPFETCTFSNQRDNSTDPGSDKFSSYWENELKTSCALVIAELENRFKSSLWTVSIKFSDGEVVSDMFSVGIYGKPDFRNEVYVTAVAGTSVKQSCASNLNYVKIYNPAGQLYAEGQNVLLDIPYVRLDDSGNWTCIILLTATMTESYVNIFLNVTDEIIVEETVSETEDDVYLLCKHSSVIGAKGACLFESPSGMIVSPMEGVAIGRYRYFGSDVKKECGLAIQKPLEDGEIGIWKCLIASPDLARYLLVGELTWENVRNNASTSTPQVSIVQGMDLNIECSLRKRLTYCYVRSPGGTTFSAFGVHEDEAIYSGKGLGLGSCQITIPGRILSINDTGLWSCGMGTDEIDDVVLPIEVTIAGSNFTAVESVKEVSYGEEALLLCRSVMKYVLKYCRFTHPSGRSFNVKLKSSGNFSFFGRGFEQGECGLHIASISGDDFGQWTCAAGLNEGGIIREYQDIILIQQPSLSASAVLGLSIGFGVLVGGAAVGFIVYENGRRNRRPSVLNVGTMQWEVPRRRLTSSSDSTSNGSTSPRISLNLS